MKEFNFEEAKQWFGEPAICRVCGDYGADALHHAFSRSGEYTGSLLNAVPVHNFECHIRIHGELMKREVQEEFVAVNYMILKKRGYKLKDLDLKFIAKYDLWGVIEEVDKLLKKEFNLV